MNKDIIGAQHEFHDKDFSIAWAERFVPTPERLELFNIILSELQALIPVGGRVVELGIGPGYLASHLLGAMPNIEYCGIDFSRPMLGIASSRLESYSSRVTYLQADLVEDDWASMVAAPIDAIVSTWALHDLGSQKNMEIVYEKSAKSLSNRGVLLNGDFIKPEGAIHEFELGRFQIDRHLQLLTNVGFSSVKCLARLEEEIDSPTPAQNYACFRAMN